VENLGVEGTSRELAALRGMSELSWHEDELSALAFGKVNRNCGFERKQQHILSVYQTLQRT